MPLITEEDKSSFLSKFVPKYLKEKKRAEKYNITVLYFIMIKNEFFKR